MNTNIRAVYTALDDEPWFSMSAWADMLEENGNQDSAIVVRWMIAWRRRPAQRFQIIRGELDVMHYWYPRPCSADTSPGNMSALLLNSNTSAHVLPIFSSMVSKPMRKRHFTMSAAYATAVTALRPWAEALALPTK